MQTILLFTCSCLVGLGSLCGQDPQDPRASREIAVPNTATRVRVFRGDGGLQARVTNDHGLTWRALARPNYIIDAQYTSFDPLIREPLVPPALAAPPGNRLFVVQFETPIIGHYRHALRRLGVEIHSFLPTQSYLVRMDRGRRADVAALPFVRWVGDYHPAYRLEPQLVAEIVAGTFADATRYNVLLVDRRRDEAALERFVTQVGGRVDMPAMGGGVMHATLTPAQLLAVASHETALWIDRWTAPEVDMDNALVQSGAQALHALSMPIDGKGMTSHVFEGIHTTHPEFAAISPYRTTPQWILGSGSSGHGTNTAGEIWARGVHPTNPSFRGGVPFAQMWYTPSSSAVRYQLYGQLTDPAGSVKAMATTASWGGGRTTDYTATSAAVDTAILDFDIFATNSQSNAGSQPSRPEAWAKNMNGIGGFLHRNNTNPNDDCWCRTGSIGPASDGRIGVTLAGYYESILTTSGVSGYTASFGGTSGATPMVNGLGQLAIQMFTNGLFGYPAAPTFQDRFEHKPHFTTTRALLMASTRQLTYDGSGTAAGANRFQQGWGFPNVRDLYDLRDRLLVIDEENATVTGPSRDVLQQGQSRSYTVFVPPGTLEFRAAMTYADPAGNPVIQSQHRVNNLDLEVVAPDGTRYYGNGGLRTGPVSVPDPTATELKDTEEMVILAGPTPPPPGAYTVRVSAPEVVADSHVETAAVDADYALVVRGIGGGRDRSDLVLDVTPGGSRSYQVSVSNIPGSGWVTGNTFISTDTSRHLSSGNWFGIESDSLTALSMRTPPTPGGVEAFTNTGSAREYPFAPASLPAPIVGAASGAGLDAVVVLYDAQGKVVHASNAVRTAIAAGYNPTPRKPTVYLTGVPCPAANPALLGIENGRLAVTGRDFRLGLQGGRAFAAWVLGAQQAQIPTPLGCPLLVNPLAVLLQPAPLVLRVPDDPLFVNQELVFQALTWNVPTAVAFSNALVANIGDNTIRQAVAVVRQPFTGAPRVFGPGDPIEFDVRLASHTDLRTNACALAVGTAESGTEVFAQFCIENVIPLGDGVSRVHARNITAPAVATGTVLDFMLAVGVRKSAQVRTARLVPSADPSVWSGNAQFVATDPGSLMFISSEARGICADLVFTWSLDPSGTAVVLTMAGACDASGFPAGTTVKTDVHWDLTPPLAPPCPDDHVDFFSPELTITYGSDLTIEDMLKELAMLIEDTLTAAGHGGKYVVTPAATTITITLAPVYAGCTFAAAGGVLEVCCASDAPIQPPQSR
ncbi:MAG: S8 family serine peptidase [Planctomycetota bacterium]